jgi:hypothetical protein
MLFFSLGQGAARILSLRGLPRRHTVKTDGPGAQPVFMTAWTGSNYRAAPTARPGEAQERCPV